MSGDPLRSGPAPSGDDVALRRAFGELDDIAGAGDTCPASDAIWASACGRDGDLDRALLAHVGSCGACAAAWRVARDMGGVADSALACGAGAGVSRSAPVARRVPRLAALVAAAVMVAAVGVALRGPGPPMERSVEYRAPRGEWIRALVPEGQPLSRAQCLLRWTPGPAGSTYDVRVMTESLDAVAGGRGLDTAEFLVAPALLERVPGHGKLVWQVTVHLPDGARNDSRSFAHELR
jgi:hypothetical protein